MGGRFAGPENKWLFYSEKRAHARVYSEKRATPGGWPQPSAADRPRPRFVFARVRKTVNA